MAEESELEVAPFGNLGIPNLAEAIEKLKAHPEIISMAASVLGDASQATAPIKAEDDVSPSDPSDSGNGALPLSGLNPPPALNDVLGLLAPILKKGGKDRDGRRKGLGKSTALLCALKPYLSGSRHETIDKLIELQKIGEILEKLS